MKKMLWILTVLLVPSLSFAQSRGDMLPFQGPTGSMSTLANKDQRSTAKAEQTALIKALSNLSEEGQAFKQVIDGFKLAVGAQLSNEQQNDTTAVDKVVSELVSRGHMTEAFNSYVTIQAHRVELMTKALRSSPIESAGISTVESVTNLPADKVEESASLIPLIVHAIDEKRLHTQKQAMLKERHALLRYLNQFDNVLLSDYLNNNLTKCTFPQDVLLQAERWQQELAAAQSVPML